MINREELTVCRRRGHDVISVGLRQAWTQCRWCGMWLREVVTMEEREDTPPESEQSPFSRQRRNPEDRV